MVCTEAVSKSSSLLNSKIVDQPELVSASVAWHTTDQLRITYDMQAIDTLSKAFGIRRTYVKQAIVDAIGDTAEILDTEMAPKSAKIPGLFFTFAKGRVSIRYHYVNGGTDIWVHLNPFRISKLRPRLTRTLYEVNKYSYDGTFKTAAIGDSVFKQRTAKRSPIHDLYSDIKNKTSEAFDSVAIRVDEVFQSVLQTKLNAQCRQHACQNHK